MSRGKDALLARARASVTAVDAPAAFAFTGRRVLIDVREPAEVEDGTLPGALCIPRGLLELEIERQVDPRRPVMVFCAAGTRSLLAARTLLDMGFSDVVSLEGGIAAWKAAGGPIERPLRLDREDRARFARHLTLAEVGEAGQLRLRAARVLVIGAGGLGSPAAYYLAAAGVGTLGLVDPDVVEVSNLQRQILHRTEDAGVLKVESARRAVEALDPRIRVETFVERFDEDSAARILSGGWDCVVDGTDQTRARYAISDAVTRAEIPLVHGAVHRFEGQVALFGAPGPCYRCLFPVPPPPEAVPSCAEAGVLGVLPGIIGTLQALEALKVLLKLPTQPGRLLRFDAKQGRFEALTVPRDPSCPACGDHTLQ